uniref:F-box protein At2g27310-like n=1 Tax=Erigeron canadensis TaxID=72917 RepID=UPI001CB8F448|nr:F-box protein At2g27310-like [Erigeron canadensis]
MAHLFRPRPWYHPMFGPFVLITICGLMSPNVVKSNSHQSDGWLCDHLASPSNLWPTELISAVEIRYQNDIIYSKVKFTDITTEFLSSELRIQLYNDPTSTVDLKIDELKCGDEATSSLLHLKEFLTLSWIIIEPARKWAVNLSSVKLVNARQDSLTKETVVQYVTILPRCGTNEMVQCKIQIVLGFGIGLVGSFYVKKVILKFQDLGSSCLNGRDFLAVTRGAIMEKNNVRRKVVEDDEERWKSYKKFKEMKKEKKESIKKEERKLEFEIKMNYIAIFVTLLFNVYFLSLLLH